MQVGKIAMPCTEKLLEQAGCYQEWWKIVHKSISALGGVMVVIASKGVVYFCMVCGETPGRNNIEQASHA